MSAPLRLGVLGAARIARGFVGGVAPSDVVTVTMVASRDADKARAFAAEFGIERSVGDYEALLAAPDIDAIYIPLPNGLHVPWAMRALKAGKHVLCEKPLAPTAPEARELFQVARERSLVLAEAFPYLAQPQTRTMRELIAAGTIGRVRQIQASFAFRLANPADVRLEPSLAGGSLLDLGTYLVSLIRVIAGAQPVEVQALAEYHAVGGVDRSLSGTLRFADGLVAQLQCSFDGALNRQALIVGSEGLIETTFRNHTSETLPGDLKLKRGVDAGAVESVVSSPPVNGFRAEAESFAHSVRGTGRWSGLSPDESIDVAAVLELLAASARERRALPLRSA